MFGVLLESRARRARQRGGAVVSVLVHMGLILFGVVATGWEPVKAVPKPTEEATVVYTPPQPVTRAPIDVPRRADGPILNPVERLPVLEYIDVAQTELPPIGASVLRTTPIEWGSSRISGLDFGTPGTHGDGATLDGIPFASGVDKPAIAVAGNPPPRYPDILRHAGIQGQVIIQVVVDTTGRADMTTVKVVSSHHLLFESAVLAVLPAYRFVPAVSADRRVKMWVLMPFVFEVRR